MKFTFKGGVHPDPHKQDTCSIPIEELPAPETLIFPVTQHIGAPGEPCVSVGDHVFMGTKLSDSTAFVSAPVHSSVSGEVVKIEPRPAAGGMTVMSVVVKNDFKDELDPEVKPIDYTSVEPDEIVNIVRSGGMVGMGGATFPTHVKLSPSPDKKIDTIIVNGAECEPYLTSDHRVMLENPEDVILGLKIVLYRFGIKHGCIGIEKNKPDAIESMARLAAKEKDITVYPLKTKYPQGGEKQLINAITGRVVPSGGLPADVGVVVLNVDTCVCIAQRFRLGMPIHERVITLAGGAVNRPTNYRVRIGTPFEYIFEQNGGFKTDPVKIIMGGPMMGAAQSRLDVPVVKGTSAILALTEKELGSNESEPCLRCGKCVDACPMNLMPLYLVDFAVRHDLDKCEEYSITDCIECGCCAYLCPSKRYNIQAIRIAKQAVIARKKARAAKQTK